MEERRQVTGGRGVFGGVGVQVGVGCPPPVLSVGILDVSAQCLPNLLLVGVPVAAGGQRFGERLVEQPVPGSVRAACRS